MVEFDIKWTVSGGLVYFNEITSYLVGTKNILSMYAPDMGHIIDSVHDCPPGLIWQGGRYNNRTEWSLDDYIQHVKSYNQEGIGVNYTFSNVCIEKHHLEDDLCNYFLEETNTYQNGVIVASDLLYDHIRENYKNLSLKASICLCNRDYEPLFDKYDMVVLSPDDNRNYELIQSLDTSKLEVLVNEPCVQNCQHRRDHYIFHSKQALDREIIRKHNTQNCIAEGFGDIRCGELVLSNDEVLKLYDLGVRNFKIQGREGFMYHISSAMDYYIRNPILRYLKSCRQV